MIQVVGEIKHIASNSHFDSDDECDSDDDDDDDDIVSGHGDDIFPATLTTPPALVSTLNLDITAMIAYVSALTNGFCRFVFKEPILSQQAEWERLRPVKIFLEKIFQVQNKRNV
jgi:hypothetical protein